MAHGSESPSRLTAAGDPGGRSRLEGEDAEKGVLEFLGLGSEAAVAYEAILSRPGCGVNNLVGLLGWPVQRVRAALDELAEYSLVRPSWEKPGEIRPIDPEVTLVALLSREERVLHRRLEEINASRLAVARLIDDYTASYRSQRRPDVEHLIGIDEIRAQIEVLADKCDTEVMTCAPGGTQQAEPMLFSRLVNEDMLRRGVLMRTIYVNSLYKDPTMLQYARYLVSLGAQVRTVGALAMPVIVYDRTAALVPAAPDGEYSGALLTYSSGLVGALCDLFLQTWQNARPLDAPTPDRGPGELTLQERSVLWLLAEGHTDETIARRIGVCVRTARRISADLMAKLGARSRFQAGVRAAELGWLACQPQAAPPRVPAQAGNAR